MTYNWVNSPTGNVKMVEIINSFEDLCRLCAGKIDVLMGLNIFASDNRQIFKKICVCLPIQVSVDDSFPKMVCVECACKLDLMFDFRERSILTAHLFSDMMTVSNDSEVMNVSQNITIESTEVHQEPDYNGEFLTCKLEEDVKYNTLTSEVCTVPCENVLTEENINLNDGTQIITSKSNIKSKISNKKLHEPICEVSGQLSRIGNRSNFQKPESVIVTAKAFQPTDHQNLNGEVAGKNLSSEKFMINSLINPNEGMQTLNHSSDLDWLFCNICNRSFEGRAAFEAHNHDNLSRDKPEYQCASENSKVQNLPNKKKKTKQKKTGKLRLTDKKNESKVCTECGKQYQTNYKLQEHMRKHTGEKPYLCSYEDCKKAFRSKIGLAQHEASHSGKYEFSCSTCGKGFQCKSYLVVHQRVHSDIKPFVCKQCSSRFKTKQSLLDHMNRHLGVKPFLCDICGRGFITKGLCKSHQKVHSGTDNRQYPCHVCRKLFVSKSYLNTHFRIHTGEKPFMCEVCGKGFLTRVDLRIHSTMHTGEKSFVCEMCGKAFARRDALRCHRRSHTGERPYKCEFCGQSFTQFSPMAIHKRLHTGERPYECDVCSKTFVSRSTMITHRKKHPPPASEETQFEIVAVEIQQKEITCHEEQITTEQIVVVEESPQLLIALSKRHSIENSEQPNLTSLKEVKDESPTVIVE